MSIRNNDNSYATIDCFSLDVGRLSVKAVERSIRRTAFDWGLDATIRKEMGLISGTIYVTVTGIPVRVNAYIRTLEETFKGI